MEEPNADSAVSQIDAGEIDVYAFAVAKPEVLQRVQGMDNLQYVQFVGGNDELTFNPVGPTFPTTGKLNPFSVAKIREAMNWLIDRNYIAQEIMGGLGLPRYVPLVGGFPDYARYIAKCRELEAKYAYNPDKAREVITEEMLKLGATQQDGKWMYNGEQVEIIALIRTEDERRDIGDYISNQLEGLGFVVTRLYKNSAESSPIWMQGNPADGQFHFYTGGWIVTSINRDQGGNFDYYFTPRGRTNPLWQAYTPSPEFDDVADRLKRNDFTTMEERDELFERALELAMEDASRFWLVDEYSFSPFADGISVAADLAGGIAGAGLWAQTLRYEGQVGGAMTLANGSIMTDPWNPIAGTNWVYDMTIARGTGDRETMPDPFTGLVWPQRIDRAEVFIKEGLPVAKTLDWVDLEFVTENQVPEDAWIDWDPVAQKFITAGEKHPEGITSNAKVVVYYPHELYDITWHDGSKFSLADIVLAWILNFDLGKPESAVYDEAQAPSLASFQTLFRGLRIVQEDPLIIEYYSDQYYMDAEMNIRNVPAPIWFPYYAQAEAAWHTLAVALMAEEAKVLAFSTTKADLLEVDWMSFIGGPSLEILAGYMEQAAGENRVPYAPTLKQFISDEEATTRWTNIKEWYRKRGHFWIGTGPFYLERAFPVEGTLILKRYDEYPDSATKWERFGKPQFAAVEIDGPGRVTIGDEVTYDVNITFEDAPYAIADIQEVKYLVFDATGALAFSGSATAMQDGLWQIALSKEDTGKLEAGSNRLEVAVVSKLVSIPTFESLDFVTVP